MSRLGVVLFNLGGPDGPDAVRPFLFNLFRDRAIIDLPAIARYPLATLISRRREAAAKANYRIMGGGSPILPRTLAQAQGLEDELNRRRPGDLAKVFVAMRYWKPFAEETARQVTAFAPNDLVLLPLYPQYSTTTTASSLASWAEAYQGPAETRSVCCYPVAEGLIASHVDTIRHAWEKAGRPEGLRLLFSAHGLPQRVVDRGDPYQAQIEATAAAIAARLPEFPDWRVCYQSRVGRLQWLEPSTENEIRAAGAEGKGVIVSPIAFVSEHVETLVELDHEYAALAAKVGAEPYLRSVTPGAAPAFIETLADAVQAALEREGTAPFGPWTCPATVGKCGCRSRRS